MLDAKTKGNDAMPKGKAVDPDHDPSYVKYEI